MCFKYVEKGTLATPILLLIAIMVWFDEEMLSSVRVFRTLLEPNPLAFSVTHDEGASGPWQLWVIAPFGLSHLPLTVTMHGPRQMAWSSRLAGTRQQQSPCIKTNPHQWQMDRTQDPKRLQHPNFGLRRRRNPGLLRF